jgi:hypothetical protein
MTLSTQTTISGITQPMVERYFDSLNDGKFEQTASLFALNGELHPPFESAIVGRDAIAIYLGTEAKGMTLYPRQGSTETLENSQTQVNITGKVKTPLFSVNVGWTFKLNTTQEILSVEVKLLASLAELANLRR